MFFDAIVIDQKICNNYGMKNIETQPFFRTICSNVQRIEGECFYMFWLCDKLNMDQVENWQVFGMFFAIKEDKNGNAQRTERKGAGCRKTVAGI